MVYNWFIDSVMMTIYIYTSGFLHNHDYIHIHTYIYSIHPYGSVSKLCTPSVHIKIAGIYGCSSPKNGMYRYWSIAIYQSYMNHIHIHISIYLYIMMTIYPQLGVALNKKTSPHRRAKHLTISVAVRLIDHLLELLCRPVISWQVFAEFHHIYIYTYIYVCMYIYIYICIIVYMCVIYIYI